MKYVVFEVTMCCDEQVNTEDVEKQIWKKLIGMKLLNTELKETGEIENYGGIL